MTDPPDRPEPQWSTDERTTLVEFLQYQRDTLQRQAFGLTDAQGATASAGPSMLTVTGLIRHMTEVERNWFRRCFNDEPIQPEYYTDERPDGDLEVEPTMSLADTIRTWRAEMALCEAIVSDVDDMGQLSSGRTRHGFQPNMRWILVHMIEEYARHCGHADLIRERIDGATDL
ncbi:MAG: Mini-circle protein [Ilumatobacteraceae bacterium]|nr:Mini-circle protein [Ilumatobacteraceae bacterium]